MCTTYNEDSQTYNENDFDIYTMKVSDINLYMVGKLRYSITTLTTRLTHGTETENKRQKLGVDYKQLKKK